jgi:phage FluMu protein Com
MAIEFHCPQCQRLMRTPDATAGKKGKCPGCGAIADIPRSAAPAARESTIAAQPAPQAAPAAPSAPPAPPAAAPDKIEFPCSQCGKPVRTAASLAGKKGKCPNCGGIFQIPVSPVPQAAKPQPQRPAAGPKPSVTSKPAVKSAPVTKSKPAAAPRPATRSAPGLTPLGASSGLTPLSAAPGLVPLDDAVGLTPLDDLAGLTPLDPVAVGGLTPLNDPLGLTPLAGEPLGGLSPIADPFAGAGLGGLGNPYQSPAAVAKPVVRKKRRSGEFGYVEVLSCTWYTFWDNWGVCLLASLLLVVLGAAVFFALSFVNFLIGTALRSLPDVPNYVKGSIAAVWLFLCVVIGFLFGLFVQAGMIRMSVAMIRGKSGGVADVFSGADHVFPLLGATILQGLLIWRAEFCFRFSVGMDYQWQRKLVGCRFGLPDAGDRHLAARHLAAEYAFLDRGPRARDSGCDSPNRPAA